MRNAFLKGRGSWGGGSEAERAPPHQLQRTGMEGCKLCQRSLGRRPGHPAVFGRPLKVITVPMLRDRCPVCLSVYDVNWSRPIVAKLLDGSIYHMVRR